MKDKSSSLIKFLPSYVGSKAYWVDRLKKYKGEKFVEAFAGSAVLSANLASKAVLNDLDPMVNKIFTNYKDLIVPKEFTQEDYYKYRAQVDWWKYIYCLQKMSFSGVFRYSKNGFNVPVKKNIKVISVQDDYNKALKKFNEINPLILCLSYDKIPMEHFVDAVVIFDPPYEGAQAAYNKDFDYEKYWKFVKKVSKVAKSVLIFDDEKNLKKQKLPIVATRKMRVNGKHQGSLEALAILGENLFEEVE